MSDLISRKAAREALQREIDKINPPFEDVMGAIRCGVRLARNIIEDLPSANPSSKLLANITVQYPEVLCVNCKHCEHRNNEEPYCHHHAMVVTPDYFCADGEEGEWMP